MTVNLRPQRMVRSLMRWWRQSHWDIIVDIHGHAFFNHPPDFADVVGRMAAFLDALPPQQNAAR